MEFRVPGPPGTGPEGSLVRVGLLGALDETLGRAGAFAVVDASVLALHGGRLGSLPRAVVPAGEAAKDLRGLEALYEAFLEAGLDRDATVVAFGGGSTCDLAGFAASTWLRGVASVYVPTTLLAMADASTGGKTGIDLGGRKNLVGSFAAPRLVLMDVAFLDSLPPTEFASGMAEVIKHAVIAGEAPFAFLEGLGGRRPRAAEEGGRDLLERLVGDSVAVKAGIVARDPLEAGERRLLNLGHTFGHALEATVGIPHGHAVAAGLATACRLSAARGALAPADLARVLALLDAWALPSSVAAAFSLAGRDPGPAARAGAADALATDKKRAGADLRFALPEGLGRVEIVALALADLEAFLMEAP